VRIGPRRHREVGFRDGQLELHGPERLSVRPWPASAWLGSLGDGTRMAVKIGVDLRELSLVAGDVAGDAPADVARKSVDRDDWVSEREAWRAFVHAIPREVVRAIVRGYRVSHWSLLVMASECEGSGALELMESAPAVALLIAERESLGGPGSGRGVNDLVYSRQRDVLAAMGFPGTKSSVKLLKKLMPSAVNCPTLRCLRTLMSHPAALDRLRALTSITPASIEILATPAFAAVVDHAFLENLVRRPGRPDHVRAPSLLRTVVAARRQFPEGLGTGKVSSVHDLETLASEARYLTDERAAQLNTPLGQPPLCGVDQPGLRAEPLSAWDQLFAEGRENKHCILTYGARIAGSGGWLYAYRILAPERATLLIRRVAGTSDSYAIDQLKGPHNREVSDKTARAIAAWLAAEAREKGMGPTTAALANTHASGAPTR
jgi:hypothetical protein